MSFQFILFRFFNKQSFNLHKIIYLFLSKHLNLYIMLLFNIIGKYFQNSLLY